MWGRDPKRRGQPRGHQSGPCGRGCGDARPGPLPPDSTSASTSSLQASPKRRGTRGYYPGGRTASAASAPATTTSWSDTCDSSSPARAARERVYQRRSRETISLYREIQWPPGGCREKPEGWGGEELESMRISPRGGAKQPRGWQPVGGARYLWERVGGPRSRRGRGRSLESEDKRLSPQWLLTAEAGTWRVPGVWTSSLLDVIPPRGDATGKGVWFNFNALPYIGGILFKKTVSMLFHFSHCPAISPT